jgi:hypothetical protein
MMNLVLQQNEAGSAWNFIGCFAAQVPQPALFAVLAFDGYLQSHAGPPQLRVIAAQV